MLHKSIFTVFFLVTFFIGKSQTVFDFEDLTVPAPGYWNGSDLSFGFGNEFVRFENDFNPAYQSWSGFAYSTLVDNVTQGFENQYSTYAGNAHSGANFGLCYIGSNWENNFEIIPSVCFFSEDTKPLSVYVSNATYTALEVLNEGGFNQFSEGDWYKLVIEGKNQGNSTGIVEYYLIDFRNSLTFVNNSWHEFDLSSLGVVTSLEFYVESSDTGDYGINTPAYFCLDDLSFDSFTTQNLAQHAKVTVYPNPTTDYLHILNFENIDHVHILDLSGRIIMSNIQTEIVSVADLSPGIYFATIHTAEGQFTRKFIKQ